ncbi:MAG: iron-containing alcohol dehydrogenase [Deltaproteobacteria bacterium]|nr:iron-containing alcohol dehydrogenase [Deltaproteobacteria bacterium]MBI2501312.1 iron-containing alcohol dehydrogenase [Deltaproteobacteria bacterium]
MSETVHAFYFPTTILFGAGAIKKLTSELKSRGCERPFVVTDSGVVRQPFFETIMTELKKAGYNPAVYSEVHANPIESDVVGGTKLCLENRADWIIAIGGGSPMDASKAIALKACAEGSLFDYTEMGNKSVPENVLPIAAIPTTAGTGSEVGRSAVIGEDRTGIKHVVFSPRLLPKFVVADPELTLNLPPSITAATGMDAMTHNVEAYLAKGFHPICDGVALEGTRYASKYLERAVKNGKDMEARSGMMLSAMMGAIAFQKGLGVNHSMAHPLTTVAGIPHGTANALCLPTTLTFNKEVRRDRLETLATHSGLEDRTAEGFITFMKKLTAAIGIPPRLRDAGVKEEMMGRLVDLAVQDVCQLENPRPVTRQDFERMYREIF